VKWRWYYNLFITFLISGLWHGANWTFIIWGALHGFYLIFAIWTTNIRNKINKVIFGSKHSLHKVFQIIITIILAWFAWIFFRANTISDAFLIIKNIFSVNLSNIEINVFYFKSDFYLAIACIMFLFIVEIFEERIGLFNRVKRIPKILKWVLFLLLLLTIFVLGKWEEADFLYFQF
jgi:D-alanyl-lipoteichoic acid acyltransferase DltB (MBOAT superfamily)